MRPSIVFFDEIDGLAPVRSSRQDQIHSSIVSTLLALMDGLDRWEKERVRERGGGGRERETPLSKGSNLGVVLWYAPVYYVCVHLRLVQVFITRELNMNWKWSLHESTSHSLSCRRHWKLMAAPLATNHPFVRIKLFMFFNLPMKIFLWLKYCQKI